MSPYWTVGIHVFFLDASELGLEPTILPSVLERDNIMMTRLEMIRQASAVRMGLFDDMASAARTKSIPKVCITSRPRPHPLISGESLDVSRVDIVVRCISSGDAHRALPITASLAVAAAAQVSGSGCAQTALRPHQGLWRNNGRPSVGNHLGRC